MSRVLLSMSALDPSGGAGLHADIKTARRIGFYPISILTALTSQNTYNVKSVHKVPSRILKEQIKSLLDDVKSIDAIKIGLIPSYSLAIAIRKLIKKFTSPIVLDPVIYSSSGRKIGDVKSYIHLLPHVDVATPNLTEAKILSGLDSEPSNIAKKLGEFGCKVVITGGELGGKDIVFDLEKIYTVEAEFSQATVHGTGCVYSTSLACYLGEGRSFEDSVRLARLITLESIKKAAKIGKCPCTNP